ncbi:MAG TPA: DMT family transporter [Burkholderiales bacterium]|nr:DMT family transporter [Burkholderiales bacterium]
MRLFLLTLLAMCAFAGNSLLCRLALRHTAIDPASFTAVRVLAGALALAAILGLRGGARRPGGNWGSALALFTYAAAFSLAYVELAAGTGALLLFGAVQATMVLAGLRRGERLVPRQLAGLATALGGLLVLLSPGITAPAPAGAALMVAAGIAWGVYSLRARGGGDPLAVTAGNFLRAVPLAGLLVLAMRAKLDADAAGVAYAIASGALTSGVGYAVWYAALPGLRAASAATVQLSVPVITAAGGALLLAEPVTLRLLGASAAVLGGIGLVIRGGPGVR